MREPISNIWKEVTCPNCSKGAGGSYSEGIAIAAAEKSDWLLVCDEYFCSEYCADDWLGVTPKTPPPAARLITGVGGKTDGGRDD